MTKYQNDDEPMYVYGKPRETKIEYIKPNYTPFIIMMTIEGAIIGWLITMLILQ